MNTIKRLTALLLVVCSLFSLAACEEYEQSGGTGGILGGIFGDGGGGEGNGAYLINGQRQGFRGDRD